MKRTFQPNNRRKARKHGFRARMSTRAGRAVLKSRRAKGRYRLSRLIGRIQSRSVFTRVRAEGVHLRSGVLSCTMVPDSTLAQPLVGYALGRSYGSAVSRNRLRRQLRELVKTRETLMQPGVYVFGASPRAATASFERLGRDLDALLGKTATAGVK